jgi:hypothetical protein
LFLQPHNHDTKTILCDISGQQTIVFSSKFALISENFECQQQEGTDMSSTQTQIYLELAPELQQLLNDNGLSIDDILRQQNLQAEVTYGVLPDQPETSARTKDPVLIILASSAAVLAVGSAISQVLRIVFHRPHVAEYYELVELKDAKGKVLLNKKGKPQLKRVKKYEILEPRKEDSSQHTEVSWNTVNGLVLKFGSAEKQMKPED